MDQIARHHYELTFRLTFNEKKGDEFQDFFASIMEKRYPGDFKRSRPWGNFGDWKNDGYLTSARQLFQCYAPNEMKSSKCLAKIVQDFKGALPYWKKYFGMWVFVHNSKAGLGPAVLEKLLSLERKHAPLHLTSWGFEELRLVAMQLVELDLASLLGPSPSREGMIELGLKDLVPVLDHIALFPAVPDPDLRPVPGDKLVRNQLSDSVAALLKLGMSRADLVRKYFKLKPILQDALAESFRSKYQELRIKTAAPDEIFGALQRFAGGNLVPSPSRQNAVLAVLAFLFEECDIFERSPAGGDHS